VLYICYASATDPLIHSQVIAYLTGLAAYGHTIHLLTFEPRRLKPVERRAIARKLRDKGIHWHHLPYHKNPTMPATVYDVIAGVMAGLRMMRRYRLNTVHARSHVPATMGIMLKRLTNCRLVFDLRGLLAEEYEDAGSWERGSLPFRITKTMERLCLNQADRVVVLTERIKRILLQALPGIHIQVIPCCADLTTIGAQLEGRSAIRAALGLQDKTVMIYTGKVGTWYLLSEMIDFFLTTRDELPALHFLIVTQSDAASVKRECTDRGIAAHEYTVTTCPPERIGSFLAAADFAISFIKPSPSKIASSPTKMGEYLAAGLPVVSNAGIGDVDALIASDNTGVIVPEFTAAAYRQAVPDLTALLIDPACRQRCIESARRRLSLHQVGVPKYLQVYSELAADIPIHSVTAPQ
jgi:glycosyltransferase involved in cell wall biosynthesis